MKKLLGILFILAISTQVFAELKPKQIVGKWKYTVETDQGEMKGIFKFVEKEGKLTGSIETDEGYAFDLEKVELKKENTLYLEFTPEYDPIKITLKVDGKKFKGTGEASGGEAPLTGEKVE